MKKYMHDWQAADMERWQQAMEIIKRICKEGDKAYLTGGAVRDKLLGKEPADIDIASCVSAEKLEKIFGRTVPAGNRKETFLIFPFGEPVEITKLKGSTIEEDLALRDFTCNAAAVDTAENVIDPFKARKAISEKILHPVVSAEKTFKDDPLRLIRAVRLSVKLQFSLSREIITSYKQMSGLIKQTPAERIYLELSKLGRHQITKSDWVNVYPLLKQLPLGLFEDTSLYEGLLKITPVFTPEQWWTVILYGNSAVWPERALPKKILKHVRKTHSFLSEDRWDNMAFYEAGRTVIQSAVLIKLLKGESFAEDPLLQFDRLPIHSVRDLKVSGRDLLHMESREIGRTLSILEKAVVTGKVSNDRKKLITYIEGENQ
jgi:tRNA nucleotidyltransferase (CCA-adding enzyme)